MPLIFSRSLRSLEADSRRPSLLGIGITGTLLLLWLWWFLTADIPVYETASQTRIEVAVAAHVIDAPASGHLARLPVKIGDEVDEGQVLAVLDTTRETSRVVENDALRRGLEDSIEALERVRDEETRSWQHQQLVDQRAVDGGLARLREAESAQRFAESEYRRARDLAEKGMTSGVDLEASRERVEQQRAAKEALAAAVAEKEAELAQHRSAHQKRLAELDRQLADLRAEVFESEAVAQRVGYDLAERVIRAPLAGRITFVTEQRPGSLVKQGDQIAELIPAGDLIAVGHFPAAARGRIKVGQKATVRLHAFPWIQYGQLRAQVSRHGTEATGNGLRVELELSSVPPTVLLEHGLTGNASVMVEHSTPAVLVLRAVGRLAMAETS